MKKYFLFLIVALTAAVSFTSCSNDDDDVNFSKEDLYGTWELIRVKFDDEWVDLTEWPNSYYGAEITFYENGSYYGDGYFGSGRGTYKTHGNTITTYIGGEVYFIYKVSELSGSYMRGTMSDGSDTVEIIARKSRGSY